MNTPIYHEITFRSWEPTILREVLEQSKIGRVPCYIHLPEGTIAEAEDLIVLLQETLQSMHIHPRFPYPVYLICEHRIDHTVFPMLKRESDLPKFFHGPKKNLNPRESELVNRINISTEKILASPMYQNINLIRDYAERAKQLYAQAQIAHYYDQLQDIL